ncbi:CehA/McbA family metallohydrolase [PVC group bacterium]|nr:CehA/McbA family metallohydrolase [PVC group bacterium]
MNKARLVGTSDILPVGVDAADWKAVDSHSHHLRGGDLSYGATNKNTVEYALKNSLAAVGVGSVWEPVSCDHYRQYEGRDRDLYYSGNIDPQSLMDKAEIQRMLDDLNHIAEGRVLFYLDNETPKGSRAHMWWFGYNYDFPAWHDYSQDRPVQYCSFDRADINTVSGKPHTRRCIFEILATQRSAGALGVFAHPTSWWMDGNDFITNIAAECVMHLYADGYLDGIAVQGYDACQRHYQNLWFHLLDTGAIVPGFAETDAPHSHSKTLNDPLYKSMLKMPDKVSIDAITTAVRNGACYCATSGFLHLSVDGVEMGGVVKTDSSRTHKAVVSALPFDGRDRFSRIELIGRGGVVVAQIKEFTSGSIEFEFSGSDTHGYLVARGYGENCDPDDPVMQNIKQFAITNPVYLHPRGYRFVPVTTDFTLHVTVGSEWVGENVEFQHANGEMIERANIDKPGDIDITLPASARVVLKKENSEKKMFYIAMENKAVWDNIKYLSTGEFLKDYPDAVPGEVPPDAFRLEKMKRDMASSTVSI